MKQIKVQKRRTTVLVKDWLAFGAFRCNGPRTPRPVARPTAYYQRGVLGKKPREDERHARHWAEYRKGRRVLWDLRRQSFRAICVAKYLGV